MSKHIRTILAIVITVSTLVGSLAPTTAQRTRDETTFVSEVSGLTVDIGDSGFAQFNEEKYEIVPVEDGVDLERVVLDVGWSELNITFFSDNLVFPQVYNANTIQFHTTGQFHEVEVLGEESNDEEGWLFTRRTLEWGGQQVHYNESYTDIGNGHGAVVTIFSHESTLIEHLKWAQENITIEGYPVLVDTDFQAIGAMLDGTSTRVPWSASNEDASLFDWTAAGIQSESEWNNNVHGHVVTWDSKLWEFPYAYYNAILRNDEANSAQIMLLNPHNSSSTTITFVEADEVRSAQEWEERWSSTSWLSNTYPRREVLASGSDGEFAGVIYFQESGYGEPVIVTRLGVNMPGGIIAFAEILSTPEMASETYLDLIDGAFIDGNSMGRLWTEVEFSTAVGQIDQSDSNSTTRSERGPSSNLANRTSRTNRSANAVEVVTSELTGATIEMSTSTDAAFMHDEFNVSRDKSLNIETIVVMSDTMRLVIYFLDGNISGDAFLGTWTDVEAEGRSQMVVLGGERSADGIWSVQTATHYLDFRELSYVEFRSNDLDGHHVAIVLESSEAAFATDLAWVQGNITINGDSVLPGADLEMIAHVASGDSNYPAEDVSLQATNVEDWAEDGLLSETDWQGPTSNTTFSWDGELWQFTYNRADAIVINRDNGSEMLVLETSDNKGMIKLRTFGGDETPASWVEWWLSEEYKDADPGFKFTVVASYSDDTTGSVILRFEAAYGEPVIVIRDVYVNDNGVTILTELFASPDDIGWVYQDFWDGVQADGDFYPLTWTIEDIQELGFD